MTKKLSKEALKVFSDAIEEYVATRGYDTRHLSEFREVEELCKELRLDATYPTSDYGESEFGHADFYTTRDYALEFTHTLAYDAMREFVLEAQPFRVVDGKVVTDIEHVKVYAYKRQTITAHQILRGSQAALDALLQVWDEEYRCNAGPTNHTAELYALAKVFADRAAEKYVVHSCEEVASRTFDVLAWAQLNAPELLPSTEGTEA